MCSVWYGLSSATHSSRTSNPFRPSAVSVSTPTKTNRGVRLSRGLDLPRLDRLMPGSIQPFCWFSRSHCPCSRIDWVHPASDPYSSADGRRRCCSYSSLQGGSPTSTRVLLSGAGGFSVKAKPLLSCVQILIEARPSTVMQSQMQKR